MENSNNQTVLTPNSEAPKISMNIPDTDKPRVVVIGGGFGGIELVKTLGKESPFQVVLFDRHNYHTFQPLLYQVATSGLEPDSIAAPLRKVFKGYKDFYFRMAEVKKIIPESNSIDTTIGTLKYDYLVIATGSRTNYYGNTELQKKAFPMKQVPQVLDLRSKILQNFENALLSTDSEQLDSLLDIVIVGGGATGVELAGALAELRKKVLPKDLPEIDFKKMDIILIENGPKLLNGMSENASVHALKYLQEFGVNVKLNTGVLNYDGYTIKLKDGSELYSQTVIWAAGVMGTIIEGLNAEAVKGSRYQVDLFNKVNGYQTIFAIGDPAAMITDKLPKGHPMLAQVAIQQGKNLANNLKAFMKNKSAVWKSFSYYDKGSMATVGRNRAVVDLPKWKFSGTFAWFTWMFVHLLFLVGFRNKVTTLINWIWNYFTFDRATRLIIRPWVKAHSENREE
ncbi:MAG: NAD(P)/FAD-dependent oxidoreductase [Cytophagaceae bacterium]